MRTILFFDDWALYESRGLIRRWPSAEPWPGLEPMTDPSLRVSFGSPVVIRDPRTQSWRMWAMGISDLSLGDAGSGVYLYDSQDGLHWTPAKQKPFADARATDAAPHKVFSGEHSAVGACPIYDPRDPDPQRRYKLVYCDMDPKPVNARLGTCRAAFSPDGIHWTIDRSAVWRTQHTDTMFVICDNPYTGKYQWTGRPVVGDRRIAIDQTADWKSFDRPFVALHPDPMDPPQVEFYGMPHFLYEGYFVGFLWRMWGTSDDVYGTTRMKGLVDAELVYSVSGLSWNRTSRVPILTPRGDGFHQYGSQYPTSMATDDDGWVRVYSACCVGEHADIGKIAPGEPIVELTVHRYRRDGFCALDTATGVGSLLTRNFVHGSGPILVNATIARFGRLRAEIRGLDNAPLPGFELNSCVPLTGDGQFLQLRWNDESGAVLDTIDSLAGRPFRIYIEAEQTRLFALRLEADILFGWVPEKNLAGTFIPNKVY